MSDQTGIDFMTGTYHIDRDNTPQRKGVPQPPLERPANDQPLINLPAPQEINLPDKMLRKVIEQRKTIRAYRETPIRMEELSYLLWCTQGVKSVNEKNFTTRTVPAAGARHALETYLLVNRVESLKTGLYQFAAINHALRPVRFDEKIAEQAMLACQNQKQVLTSAVTFFWVAAIERLSWRYMARGYRYVLLDAGHVCQNLYLAAESLDCGVCAIAAFADEALNQFLGVDGEQQFVVYAASLGKKAEA